MSKRLTYRNGNEEFSFVTLLKACAVQKNLRKGASLHADVLKRGLNDKSPYISSALINMYAKCGALSKAQELLDELHTRNHISWNALISGYVQQGQYKEALSCYEQMRREEIIPNAVTFVWILKICGKMGAIDRGREIHDEIFCKGLLVNDIVLGTALVDMYVKCGVLTKAKEVHHELNIRDVVSWSALISGYAQHGHGQEALNCMHQMQGEGLLPNAITFTCILKSCGSIGAVDKGKQIHVQIAIRGFLEKDTVLGTALVDMYAKSGVLVNAQQVHDGLSARDVISWSALIAGYAHQGKARDALNCYERMQGEGHSPDEVTFVCILKACGISGDIATGQKIHEEIAHKNLVAKNVTLATALIDMYAACGELAKAQHVHNDLQGRDVASWNVLIAGYAQQGQGNEAFHCFEQMQREGLSPDVVTFTSILKVCGNIGAMEKGIEIHDCIVSRGLLGEDRVIGTALVDMYVKCGLLTKAQQVHDDLRVQDVVSWSVLIAGYAQEGQGHEALQCLKQMQGEGHCPDLVTILSVLSAFSRSGQLAEAQACFGNMRKEYDITPDLKHHACMVVNFGYTGNLRNAMAIIDTMPSKDHLPVWLALLGACRKWGNLKLGRLAFNQAIQIDSSCSGAYVLMANAYTAAGMHEDAEKIEVMRLKNVAWKELPNSMRVDASGVAHYFSVADAKHPGSNDMFLKLKDP